MTPPILLDLPDQLETERLLLRSPMPGDGAEVHAAAVESREELLPWMPWAEAPSTPEEAEVNVRQARVHYLERSDLRLHLFLKGTGTLVGSSGLHRINWDVPRFEIGYWCRTRFTGRGYVTEAVRRITAFAFHDLGANRVEIRAAAPNARSRAVAERCGYPLEATLRNNYRRGGELHDTVIYALTPDLYRDLPR